MAFMLDQLYNKLEAFIPLIILTCLASTLAMFVILFMRARDDPAIYSSNEKGLDALGISMVVLLMVPTVLFIVFSWSRKLLSWSYGADNELNEGGFYSSLTRQMEHTTFWRNRKLSQPSHVADALKLLAMPFAIVTFAISLTLYWQHRHDENQSTPVVIDYGKNPTAKQATIVALSMSTIVLFIDFFGIVFTAATNDQKPKSA